MTRDLVCGMTVDEARAPRSSHGGRIFHFCSSSCRASADQSPGEYERLADLIPTALARLPELVRNLWWSWHPEATALFEALSQASAEPARHHPLHLLLELNRQTLDAFAREAELTPSSSAGSSARPARCSERSAVGRSGRGGIEGVSPGSRCALLRRTDLHVEDVWGPSPRGR
jgi:YHS domain-containing protein